MDSRNAFDAIKCKIDADPAKRLIESFFDERAFGNFWITYEEAGDVLSVVNDRGAKLFKDEDPLETAEFSEWLAEQNDDEKTETTTSYIVPEAISFRRASESSGSRYCSIVDSSTPRDARMKSIASRPAPAPPASGVT